ncbi:MAG: non-homologous end-joining DNA ligase [Streptosporangiales bacterium]|nr:non-homologous end-joining DNA ligase [Streptosporangiales bacterium]MBO0889673.1 non-homologous end-joining DNA ligase [Acidothermales bacterium]
MPFMLAVLTDDYFSDPDWVYERKLDGERVLAVRDGASVRLVSRNDKTLDGHYPEVVEALESQSCDRFVLDGEVVAFEAGRTSFARLQQRMQVSDPERARATGVAVFYYVFDLLHVAGHDVDRLPLRQRKALLRKAIAFGKPLRYTTHRVEHGERYLAEACRRGWEGLIAKRADAPYTGRRSGDWLKFKCVNEQELVVGGFTEPAGSRVGLGALLVGHYADGRFRYAGKVGTGYDRATLLRLRERLDGLERAEPAFAGVRKHQRGVHWVEPELVAQIGFTEWTTDGMLRHPRFLGLREDKDPRDVVRERPRR